jgi:hypothetical protein
MANGTTDFIHTILGDKRKILTTKIHHESGFVMRAVLFSIFLSLTYHTLHAEQTFLFGALAREQIGDSHHKIVVNAPAYVTEGSPNDVTVIVYRRDLAKISFAQELLLGDPKQTVSPFTFSLANIVKLNDLAETQPIFIRIRNSHRNPSPAVEISLGTVERQYESTCLVGGNCILMSDGSFKPIQEVQLNDEVLSVDLESRLIVPRKVTALHRGFAATDVDIHSIQTENDGQIFLTRNHNIFIHPTPETLQQLTAVPVQTLDPATNKLIQRVVIDGGKSSWGAKNFSRPHLRLASPAAWNNTPVYNITVAGDRPGKPGNYFVGTQCGILLSNLKSDS